MSELLEISNLYFSYDEKRVLNNVGFKLREKEILCIMGKNGSGKTTLFKVLSGIYDCRNCKVKISGKKASSTDLKKKIMFIPSAPYLYSELTGMENIELIRNLWNVDKERYYNRIYKYIAEYGMESFVNDFVKNYSLGMKYKLYYIATISVGQDIILMDEPLSAMDCESQDKAIADLKEYVETGKRAIVFSSHISQLISDLSSKQLLLENGKIQEVMEK